MKKDWKDKDKKEIVDDPNPFLKPRQKKKGKKKGRVKSKFDRLDLAFVRD